VTVVGLRINQCPLARTANFCLLFFPSPLSRLHSSTISSVKWRTPWNLPASLTVPSFSFSPQFWTLTKKGHDNLSGIDECLSPWGGGLKNEAAGRARHDSVWLVTKLFTKLLIVFFCMQLQVCAIVCACSARALSSACPDGHMEDGDDSVAPVLWWIEQDQSSVTHTM